MLAREVAHGVLDNADVEGHCVSEWKTLWPGYEWAYLCYVVPELNADILILNNNS